MKKLITLLVLVLAFFVLPPKAFASGVPYKDNSAVVSGPTSSLPADGVTKGSLVLSLKDSSNNPVAYDSISLSSSNDSTAVFNNPQVTGADGTVTFTVTSTTAGTTNITLTDNTNAVTFTDWISVTFYASALGCSNVPAAPVLTSVVSNSNNTATLIWTDSASPVSNYLVSYGIASGKYIYGDANIGPQGTTTFTVGSLSGNKTYYFVIAASNNCGASPFSNEMSVIVNPVPTPVPTAVSTPTPIATPQDVVSAISIAPTGSPEALAETPAPVAPSGGNSIIKTIAIILIAAGTVILALIIVVRKSMTKKKPEIPLIGQTPQVSTATPPARQIPQNPVSSSNLDQPNPPINENLPHI